MTVRRTLAALVSGALLAAAPGVAAAATGPARSFYDTQQLQTMSESWAVRAALSKLTPAERAILAQAWETSAPAVVTPGSRSFAWGEFGIGAAATLGLVLLAGGGLLAVRSGRRLRVIPARAGA
jgi:hypothetical protein